MISKDEQIHAMDKQVSLLQHEVIEIRKLITSFTDRLESLFSTQTEILNSSMPEFERTTQLAENLNIRVRRIEHRHELKDIEAARREKLFSWSLSNWKLVFAAIVLLGGAYEAGRALYLAPSPKYNAQTLEKLDAGTNT